MGTATMQFKEGIIVTGSTHQPDGTDSDFSLVTSGSLYVTDAAQINTVHVLANGRVGIGTDAPAYKLEVGGSMSVGEKIIHRNDDDTFIRYQDDVLSMSAGGVEFVTLEENSSQPSNFFVNKGFADMDFSVMGQGLQNMDLFYVDASDGNVGIGTQPDESYKLHVSGSTITYALIGEGGDGQKSTQIAALLLSANKGSQSVTASFGATSPAGVGSVLLGSESDHDLFLRTGGSTVMTLSASNDVGIGTTSPDSRLHVNDTGGNTIITVGDNTTQNELSEIILKASKHSNSVSAFLAGADTGGGASQLGSVGTISNHDFIVKTNSTNRVTVKNSGNVTIEKDLYILEDLHVTGTFRPSSIGVNTNFAVADGSIRIEKRGNAPSFLLLHSASSFTANDLPDDTQTSFGTIQFRGSDNTTSGDVAAAEITATTDRNGLDASNGLMPTSIVFSTGDEDSNGTKERMRITSRGRLGVGRKNPVFTLQVERSGSTGAPSFGLVRRGVDVSSNTEMHRINFSLVGNDDDGIVYFTPAQIVARNIQDIRINPNENEVESPQHGIGTELIFRTTVSGSTTTQNAAILTADKEWECDTLRGINTETNDQRIAFNFDNVDVPIGPNINVKNRIDFFAKGDEGNAIRHAAFMGNFNAYTEQVNTDTTVSVPRQPNRAYFNPDSNSDFQFRFDSANGGALLAITSSATTTGQDGQINMGSSTNAGNGYVNIWKPATSNASPDISFNNVSDTSANRDIFLSFYHQTIENARITTTRDSGDSFDASFAIKTRANDISTLSSNFSDRIVITKSGSILFNENNFLNTNASSKDTSFFVSGTIGLSGNNASISVFGGDIVSSGAIYFEELSTTPGAVADGTVALYGKDDSGVTKLYFKNESGETEIGSGGGGGTTNKTVVYGSITLSKNGTRTVSFDRQTSLGGAASANVKGMLFAPFNGTVSKIMVMLKTGNSNPVTTSTHGTITAKIFKNADNYGSSAFSGDKVGDNFSQVNADNPGISRGTFSPNTSFNEGDLLQFTIGRDNNGTASNSEGIITIVLSES